MLKKSFKLKSKDKLISFVLKKGKELKNKHFTIRFLEAENNKTNKYAIIIGNKISKKAVERNLLRRRIFNIIKNNNQMETDSSKNIVILPRKSVLEFSFNELEDSLIPLLNKI